MHTNGLHSNLRFYIGIRDVGIRDITKFNLKTVFLDKNKHKRSSFDCGVKVLNNYLFQMANQQSKKDNTRTYILENTNNPSVIKGYYTLTMISLNLGQLPKKMQNIHKSSSSAGLIARLAVDKKHSKQGIGQWLLADALNKLLSASNAVAFL